MRDAEYIFDTWHGAWLRAPGYGYTRSLSDAWEYGPGEGDSFDGQRFRVPVSAAPQLMNFLKLGGCWSGCDACEGGGIPYPPDHEGASK